MGAFVTASPSDGGHLRGGEAPSTSTARKIFMGGAKLATGAVLAIVALAILSAVIFGIVNRRNTALGEPKVWSSVDRPSLGGATFNLVTMWRANQLNYILEVRPYTAPIREARESSQSASFTVRFLDDGTFSVATATVNLDSMTRIVDATGEPQALRYEGSTSFLSAGDYRRIAGWTLQWSIP